MFTIKYRRYNLAAKQCTEASTPFFDPVETIDGPFAQINQEYESGYMVVYAHRSDGELGMSYGPNNGIDGPQSPPRPTLWIMNEHGATVAKYDL